MNEITNTEAILEKCRISLQKARGSLMESAGYLYRIREEKLYTGSFESFSAYLEDIGVSDSMASKLITSFERFCIQGGFSQEKIAGVDVEKLYLVTKLQGTPEHQLQIASSLTRSEIKQELAEKDGHDCAHDCEHVTICTRCHARV